MLAAGSVHDWRRLQPAAEVDRMAPEHAVEGYARDAEFLGGERYVFVRIGEGPQESLALLR